MNRVVPLHSTKTASSINLSINDEHELKLLHYSHSLWSPIYRTNYLKCGHLYLKAAGTEFILITKGLEDENPLTCAFIDEKTKIIGTQSQGKEFCFEIQFTYSCNLESGKSHNRKTFTFIVENSKDVSEWVDIINKNISSCSNTDDIEVKEIPNQPKIGYTSNNAEVVIEMMTSDILNKARRKSSVLTKIFVNNPVIESENQVTEMDEEFLHCFRERSKSTIKLFQQMEFQTKNFSNVLECFVKGTVLVPKVLEYLVTYIPLLKQFAENIEDKMLVPFYNPSFSNSVRDQMILLTDFSKELAVSSLSLLQGFFLQSKNGIICPEDEVIRIIKEVLKKTSDLGHCIENFRISVRNILILDDFLRMADEKIRAMIKSQENPDIAPNESIPRQYSNNLKPFDRICYILSMDCTDILENSNFEVQNFLNDFIAKIDTLLADIRLLLNESCFEDEKTKNSVITHLENTENTVAGYVEIISKIDERRMLSLQEQVDFSNESFLITIQVIDLLMGIHALFQNSPERNKIASALLKSVLSYKHRSQLNEREGVKRTNSNSGRRSIYSQEIENFSLSFASTLTVDRVQQSPSVMKFFEQSSKNEVAVNKIICRSLTEILDYLRERIKEMNEFFERNGRKQCLSMDVETLTDTVACILHQSQQLDEESQSLETEFIEASLIDKLQEHKSELFLEIGAFCNVIRTVISGGYENYYECQTSIIEMRCESLKDIIYEISNLKYSEKSPECSAQQLAMMAVEKYLSEEESNFFKSGEIIFKDETDKIQIKGGTLPGLTRYLTNTHQPDGDFVHSFLLTYSCFISSKQFLNFLLERYKISIPIEFNKDQLMKLAFIKKGIIPVKLRVLNVLKISHELAAILHELVNLMKDDFKKGTEDFVCLLAKLKRQSRFISSNITFKQYHIPDPPPSILPKFENFKISDLDPLELARQITLIDWENFSSVKAKEFLQQKWTKPETAKINSPNIMSMIDYSNSFVYWIGSEIVGLDNPKQRANLIKLFILTADQCRQLNNFNSLKMILAALNSSSIQRLKKTWEFVSNKLKNLLKDLCNLMSEEKSYKNYRQTLSSCEPPCIPFLGNYCVYSIIGMYLTNLVFIEIGNRDFIENDLINFDKHQRVAKIIDELISFQRISYQFYPVYSIQSLIREANHLSEDEIYNQSLKIEPRDETS
ncbi:Guanine-nucleotide dissociation stimulator CDC25 domain-containing protein [Rozella allomycis CSF55]|uniref:Guanine-nucleotide dissociation stimulator CDC25 domain-containing protein n=1 Tax=Rozella allomycis (strain CSF55) TaxID=988480 RepID=A0A075B4B6_ROZAC|nr:Guanine-nucleotide dissociation stimulator CDC25 domain-containing protein [Rozella allomycis CSF55]|eukprot:EPZ36032.1 Guanine-nucleotide dissociation stimulator CDC25 domain-containing protein [Rozella allomycis CSF55]